MAPALLLHVSCGVYLFVRRACSCGMQLCGASGWQALETMQNVVGRMQKLISPIGLLMGNNQ